MLVIGMTIYSPFTHKNICVLYCNSNQTKPEIWKWNAKFLSKVLLHVIITNRSLPTHEFSFLRFNILRSDGNYASQANPYALCDISELKGSGVLQKETTVNTLAK